MTVIMIIMESAPNGSGPDLKLGVNLARFSLQFTARECPAFDHCQRVRRSATEMCMGMEKTGIPRVP